MKPQKISLHQPRIKSVSYSQDEILRWVSELYLPQGIELDVTYGKGYFYRQLPKPRLKFDLSPRFPEMVAADVRNLPLRSESISSIIFDPPFLARNTKFNYSLMVEKYGFVGNVKSIWKLYQSGMTECCRVLVNRGFLIVKCQDCIYGRYQYMTHVEVCNHAIGLGFYPVDIFILVSKTRPVAWNHDRQLHSRKYHSYFWIFQKIKRPIPYITGDYYVRP